MENVINTKSFSVLAIDIVELKIRIFQTLTTLLAEMQRRINVDGVLSRVHGDVSDA